MPFLRGAICLRCFTCIFIQTKNHSCMLSLSTSLYNEALSISLTKSFKRSRPISLWDSNPLVLAYQANSFTISELQLRVFQNGRRGEFRNPGAFALVPKTSPLPSTVYSPQKLNKTRLTFEFSRFGFKFAVCVFQSMVDRPGAEPGLAACKAAVLPLSLSAH